MLTSGEFLNRLFFCILSFYQFRDTIVVQLLANSLKNECFLWYTVRTWWFFTVKVNNHALLWGQYITCLKQTNVVHKYQKYTGLWTMQNNFRRKFRARKHFLRLECRGTSDFFAQISHRSFQASFWVWYICLFWAQISHCSFQASYRDWPPYHGGVLLPFSVDFFFSSPWWVFSTGPSRVKFIIFLSGATSMFLLCRELSILLATWAPIWLLTWDRMDHQTLHTQVRIFFQDPNLSEHVSEINRFSDFVVVQSAWGMTQGFVMPLSGFLITAIGEKVNIHKTIIQLKNTFWKAW